jgi:hypothetical protein
MGKLNDLQNTKDPRGLVQRDLAGLREVFKPITVKPTTCINRVMYNAGQQAVLDYIDKHLVG